MGPPVKESERKEKKSHLEKGKLVFEESKKTRMKTTGKVQ